jgi:hypothetical protein
MWARYGPCFTTSRSRRERVFFFAKTKIPPKYGIYGLEPTADHNPGPKRGAHHTSPTPATLPKQFFLYLNWRTPVTGVCDVVKHGPYRSSPRRQLSEIPSFVVLINGKYTYTTLVRRCAAVSLIMSSVVMTTSSKNYARLLPRVRGHSASLSNSF